MKNLLRERLIVAELIKESDGTEITPPILSKRLSEISFSVLQSGVAAVNLAERIKEIY